MQDREKKIFLLGVGCQKGGTTWLHSQLMANEQVDLGFTKEYHVFDVLHLKGAKYFKGRKVRELKEVLSKDKLMSADKHLLKYIDFYRDTNNYYDYFDYLWYKNPKTTLVGDITPSYSGLPATVYQEIKHQLELRGFTVKVIFIMRDPVERCRSMTKMGVKILNNTNRSDGKSPEETLEELYDTEFCESRTDYQSTIHNLEQVFDKENLYYGLYETLFEESNLKAIKEFLELSEFNPDINKKVNFSQEKNSTDTPELSEKIAKHYSHVYEFCAKNFNTEKHWNGYKLLENQ